MRGARTNCAWTAGRVMREYSTIKSSGGVVESIKFFALNIWKSKVGRIGGGGGGFLENVIGGEKGVLFLLWGFPDFIFMQENRLRVYRFFHYFCKSVI